MKYIGQFHLAISMLFLLTACSPKSVEDYNTASTETDTVRLLNQREYGKVIWLLENRDGKFPTDKKTAFLLSEAYLGKAGFEPLRVAAAVGNAQASSDEQKEFLGACPNGPLGPLREADPLCLLKRVYSAVPDPDVYEMARARELLRYAYPDPAKTPTSVNVLIGTVEMASLIKRIGTVYLYAQTAIQTNDAPTDQQIQWFARQLKESVDEADQTMQRADHTGHLISQVLTGSKGAIWFDEAKGVIGWAEKDGLGGLVDLFKEYALSPQDQEKYNPVLDKIRDYLNKQNDRISAL